MAAVAVVRRDGNPDLTSGYEIATAGTSDHRLDCSWVVRMKSWPNGVLSGSCWQSCSFISLHVGGGSSGSL